MPSMLPILIHHCGNCSFDTSIPYTASVFSEIHYCTHCGSSSNGVRLREGANDQAETVQQDELSALFTRSLNFSNPTPPPEKSLPPLLSESEPSTPIYASQHYIPNQHVAPVRHTVPVRFFTPPQVTQTEPLTDDEMVEALVRNSIDPYTLFPSQVTLLRNADGDQRLRLLELWRISPPNLGCYDLAKEQATWLSTTLQQEEQMARLRYERQHSDQILNNVQVPELQEVERPSSAPESSRSRATVHAEPYMMSGYEQLALREYEQSLSHSDALKETTRYNRATDPAFRVFTAVLWDKRVVDTENRYGILEQVSNSAPANVEDGAFTAAALNGLDEEMVM